MHRQDEDVAQPQRFEEVQRSNIAKLRELGSIQQLSAASPQPTVEQEELFAVTALDKNKKKTNRKGFLALRDGRLMYLKDSDKVVLLCFIARQKS